MATEVEILDLPPELLLEIAGLVQHTGTHHDVTSLRSTSRYLSEAISPLWFRRFRISFDQLSAEQELGARVDDILENIASGSGGWAVWARELVIFAGGRDTRELGARAEAETRAETRKEAFVRALGRMRSIRRVDWIIGESEPGWFVRIIDKTMHALAHLADLSVRVYGHGVRYDLTGLTHLSRLKVAIRAPRFLMLNRLNYAHQLTAPPQQRPVPAAQQITAIILGSRTLTSLDLSGITDIAGVWTALASSGLCLRELYSGQQAVTKPLLEYIASYSGLEKLHLAIPDGQEDGQEALAEGFYSAKVLGRHADTLQEFCCVVGKASKWCFGAHNVVRLLTLSKLQRLEVTVSAEGNDEIKIFFSTFTSLPFLRTVALFAAVPPPNPMMGINMFTHAHGVNQGVRFRAELCRLNWRQSAVGAGSGLEVVEHHKFQPSVFGSRRVVEMEPGAAWAATIYRPEVGVEEPPPAWTPSFIMYSPTEDEGKNTKAANSKRSAAVVRRSGKKRRRLN
ncbi:hypothetical protein C8F01DRAFT_1155610 [Mycena amicta]|nr:hypothetical protein C8F01DRAFT_1155610 [Mycena amicta]